MSQPRHPVSSVENALRILVMLRSRPSVRVSEVSAELDVARSTAHRLLTTLASHRAVEQDPVSREYRIGPLVLELGQSERRLDDVVSSLRPHLEYLGSRVDETVHVMVVEGTMCRFVDSVECPRPLRVTGRVGTEYPAHTTSGGKALLAAMSDAQLCELYPDEDLPPHNERSLPTRARLFRELEDVRLRGYALNRGESSEGIVAIAVAQRLSRAATPVAIAVSAPDQRMPQDRVDEVVAELTEVQRRLHQTFG
jgi:DNA-binding IclR family transcriptional regulator